MRILSLSNSPLDPTLGSGKTVLRWTEGLTQRGHQCVTVGSDALLSQRWGRLPGRRFWLALGGWRELRRQVARFRPELVEFYGAEFGWASASAKRWRRRPYLVAHTNGLELLAAASAGLQKRRLASGLHSRLDRAAFRSVDGFVALCEPDREYLVKQGFLASGQTAVVEPGLDSEYLQTLARPLDSREHAVAYTGSWISRKDTATIAAVMDGLLLSDSRLTFRFFGAPGAEEAIRARFSPAVQGRITVAGKLSNAALAEELARCKVFFFPSVYEGFGIATAEAMACGCAVVATPTGLAGSLVNGVEAYIRPTGDREGLAAAVRALLENEPRRQEIAGAGRARVARLTWEAQTAKLDGVYTEWMSRWRADRRGDPLRLKSA